MPDRTAMVHVMASAQREHFFVRGAPNMTYSRCRCGYRPETSVDWERHQLAVAYDALLEAGVIHDPPVGRHRAVGVSDVTRTSVDVPGTPQTTPGSC